MHQLAGWTCDKKPCGWKWKNKFLTDYKLTYMCETTAEQNKNLPVCDTNRTFQGNVGKFKEMGLIHFQARGIEF